MNYYLGEQGNKLRIFHMQPVHLLSTREFYAGSHFVREDTFRSLPENAEHQNHAADAHVVNLTSVSTVPSFAAIS